MTPTSSQREHPWRAAARTAVQALVAVPTVLGVVAAVLVVVGEADVLPPAWAAWAAAAAVTVSGVAGLVARVMAVPGVDTWLDRVRLGSVPSADDEPRWEQALRGELPPGGDGVD